MPLKDHAMPGLTKSKSQVIKGNGDQYAGARLSVRNFDVDVDSAELEDGLSNRNRRSSIRLKREVSFQPGNSSLPKLSKANSMKQQGKNWKQWIL